MKNTNQIILLILVVVLFGVILYTFATRAKTRTEFKTSSHGAYIEVVNSAVDIAMAKELIVQEVTMEFIIEKVKTYTMGETYQDSMLSDIRDSRVIFEMNLRKVYAEK